MLMQNYVAIGIVSVMWVLVVFSLAFSKGNGAIGEPSSATCTQLGLDAHERTACRAEAIDIPRWCSWPSS